MKNLIIFAGTFTIILFSCNNNTQPAAPENTNIAEVAIAEKGSPDIVPNNTPISDAVFDDGSIPSSWEIAGITNPTGLTQFITSFQQWVADNNKDSIAAHINFPLRRIKSREDFLQKYAAVFNSEVKKKIADQNIRQIFRNENGVMLADGAVWINQKGQDFIITALNFNPKK
jgi:hypothetical protein